MRLLEITVGSDFVFADALGVPRDKIGEFARRSQCVSYLFSTTLGPVDTGKVWKVAIRIMKRHQKENDPEHLSIYGPGDRWISGAGGDVLLIHRYLDVPAYFASEQPKKLILDVICQDLVAAAIKHRWDVGRFKETCKELAESDLVFRYQIGTSKLSRNRKKKACALLEADEDTSKLTFLVEDVASGKLIEYLAAEDIEFWTDYVWSANGPQWLDNDTLALAMKPRYGQKFKHEMRISD